MISMSLYAPMGPITAYFGTAFKLKSWLTWIEPNLMLPQMNMVLETKWVNWFWIESSKSLLEFNWNLLWMFRHRQCSVCLVMDYVGSGCLMREWWKSTGSHSPLVTQPPLSPSAAGRLGRFRTWKDIAPEFIGGYILGEVQQLYIEEDMGGTTWEVGAADLRRIHRETLRQRTCIQWTFVLTSS